MNVQRGIDLILGSVWLVMGLYCKLLGRVPRHEQIVAEVLGPEHAAAWTRAIGIGEILLGLWIATGWRRKTGAILQISLVMLMNALEMWRASDLLLWGPANFLFALMFCGLVYWNAFRLPWRSPCSQS